MTISVLIPHYPVTEAHNDLLTRCVASLRGYDELIVLSDMGQTGFTKKVNELLRRGTSDYLMVVNNDIVWEKGSLADLCVPGTITSPYMRGHGQFFWGCFFVLPREVYLKLGPLDEQFFLYCSDTDYAVRANKLGIPMKSIEACDVFTEGGQTTKDMTDRAEMDNEDTKKFIAKWKMRPDAAMSLIS